MFAEFSNGYYLGRLYVEPHDGSRAVMQRDQHERVNEQLYTSGWGVERLDQPLVMKLDRRHFAVHGDESVPENTLAVPETMVDDCDIDRIPSVREVLLAKAERAAQLLALFSDPTDRVHRNDAGT